MLCKHTHMHTYIEAIIRNHRPSRKLLRVPEGPSFIINNLKSVLLQLGYIKTLPKTHNKSPHKYKLREMSYEE